MSITDEMLLEIAREGAAMAWDDAGSCCDEEDSRAGQVDDSVPVQAGLYAARLMVERGFVMRPSVDCVWDALHRNTQHVFDRTEAGKIHAALFSPSLAARIRAAVERGASDAELEAIAKGEAA